MPNTDHTGAALADELEREATIEHCGSDIAIGSYLRGRLPAILAALRTPAPVNAEQPEGLGPQQRPLSEAFNGFAMLREKFAPNPTAEQPAEPQPSVVDAVHQALQRAWDQSDTLPPLTFMHEEGQKLARAALAAAKPKEMELLREAGDKMADLLAGIEDQFPEASPLLNAWSRAIDATLTNGDG